MAQYMLDTNIFNHILDGSISLNGIEENAELYATHIQMDELNNTTDQNRRNALIKVFKSLINNEVPTESTILDVSRLGQSKLGGNRIVPTESAIWCISKWDQASWAAEDSLYEPIKNELDKNNGYRTNNIQDALIAETAIKNNIILVTRDRDLFTIASKFGCLCMESLPNSSS
jgi:predicted nucleic acid-binding protein